MQKFDVTNDVKIPARGNKKKKYIISNNSDKHVCQLVLNGGLLLSVGAVRKITPTSLQF